jgi:predicted GNAT family N-acyltransferase
MKIHIIPFDFGTPEYDESVRLRDEILRKPLGLEYSAGQLAAEYNDLHLGAYNENLELLGSLILTSSEDNKWYKMRQVAVKAQLQGHGVGRALVMYCHLIASQEGKEGIYCHARQTAVPFYEKLGYVIEGEVFYEVNIPHLKMRKSFL